eukprot:10212940-Alexandrium_andersonii.AAC.1
MSASLVGSEMCIRDRSCARLRRRSSSTAWTAGTLRTRGTPGCPPRRASCLLYTSDAADDM